MGQPRYSIRDGVTYYPDSPVLPFVTNGTGNPMAANKSLKDMIDDLTTYLTFKHQTQGGLNQASPVQNQWYTIKDTVTNVKIYKAAIAVYTTNETLDARITVDGEVMVLTGLNAVASSIYYVYFAPASGGNAMWASTTEQSPLLGALPLEARSFKFEMRKTSAAGNGNLGAFFVWARRV